MIARYIKLMDFEYENVELLNVGNEDELINKIKEGEVIQVRKGPLIYGVNSNYIMWYML